MVDHGALSAVMDRRDDRPLLVVDIAVPRDVDPAVADIDGVTLLDMDDLRAHADAGLAQRRREIGRVQAIIEDEVQRHGAASTARAAAPLVGALHDRGERLRQAELERFAGRLAGLDPRERAAVEALTQGVVAKLLHDPTVRLKEAIGTPRGERLAEAITDLFDL
jgi:glutamyl-tRNA reductase